MEILKSRVTRDQSEESRRHPVEPPVQKRPQTD